LNVPAGTAVNDILLACINVAGGTAATITAPSGWTLIASVNETTNMKTAAYWRLATGYETGSYTWTFDTTRQAAAIMLAYSGAYGFLPPQSATNSTSTASTSTASIGSNSTYETGLSIQFFGAYNATSATTMTAGGTYVQRVDTCTTANAFMEVAVQDVSKGLLIGGLTASPATISSAATSTAINFYLEDQRPAYSFLAEDEFIAGSSSSGSGFTSRTSGLFTTNYPNEVLLAFMSINQGATTISSVTGGGLTWVNAGRANSNSGSVELWRALAPTPLTGFTLTSNFSATTKSFNYLIVGMVGADLTGTNGSGAIGALSTAAITSTAPTVTLTSTRNNSWVWGMANNSSSTNTATAGSNQTIIRNAQDSTNLCRSWVQRQNSLTAASGTVVTINDTAPTTDTCNILAVEILPAVYHHLGTLGVG
jgi:hypothetical protein